ncbi:hypothetical protein HRbin17_01086 [bacterium HR17]|uniref:Uncharacterized protein n=1 Tax=Candidatus Fervidibacter japonicus TaxID=2035412 RepID=A0A2H5XBL4_9BACT|nr:hypothetical protein HRbin17_01086 [bacterium HR17]
MRRFLSFRRLREPPSESIRRAHLLMRRFLPSAAQRAALREHSEGASPDALLSLFSAARESRPPTERHYSTQPCAAKINGGVCWG